MFETKIKIVKNCYFFVQVFYRWRPSAGCAVW